MGLVLKNILSKNLVVSDKIKIIIDKIITIIN